LRRIREKRNVKFIIKLVLAVIVGAAVAMFFGHMFGFLASLAVRMLPFGRP
jgi:uncharacterized membrane protein YgaE (UPF0421/DUF939 family)